VYTRAMKARPKAIVIVLLFGFALTGLAQTNSLPSLTVGGVVYSNVIFKDVTPATVKIFHSTGVATVPM
jgi:hypothetical protein